MLKKLKIAFVLLSFVIVLGGTAYCGFWFYMAYEIRKEVTAFIEQSGDKDIAFTGTKPDISGFPGPHEVTLSGRLSWLERVVIDFPQVKATGFFLPGQTIDIELPKGARLAEPQDQKGLWTIKSALLSAQIPENIPPDMTHESLRQWQASGGELVIEDLQIIRPDLELRGKGAFSLNNALQPEGKLDVRLERHLAFFETLQEAGVIEKKQALLFSTILAAASQTDEETGELYMNQTITLRNSTVFAGPVKVASLPVFEYPRKNPDRRNPPAPPQ